MSSPAQRSYIDGLAVAKTKEFKEVKELLVSSEIVKDTSEIVMQAESLAEITNALDDGQASRFIDVLIQTKAPARGRVYSQKRVESTIKTLDDIKKTINNWGF
jgi:hypothetical protein